MITSPARSSRRPPRDSRARAARPPPGRQRRLARRRSLVSSPSPRVRRAVRPARLGDPRRPAGPSTAARWKTLPCEDRARGPRTAGRCRSISIAAPSAGRPRRPSPTWTATSGSTPAPRRPGQRMPWRRSGSDGRRTSGGRSPGAAMPSARCTAGTLSAIFQPGARSPAAEPLAQPAALRLEAAHDRGLRSARAARSSAGSGRGSGSAPRASRRPTPSTMKNAVAASSSSVKPKHERRHDQEQRQRRSRAPRARRPAACARSPSARRSARRGRGCRRPTSTESTLRRRGVEREQERRHDGQHPDAVLDQPVQRQRNRAAPHAPAVAPHGRCPGRASRGAS